ncbi:MAG: ABC transporter ATP-binding protein [Prevotella sp.]|nr:ABC transporter ATP-binding protein [Prevotella sp.]
MRLTDASIGFRSRHGAPKVLASSMSACVERGRLTCLVGRNGKGKSTLLRALAGFDDLQEGSLEVRCTHEGEERAFSSLSNVERSKLVAVVLTNNSQAHGLTVEELVGLGRSPYTNFWGTQTETDRQVVDKSMELTGVSHLRKYRIETLSDGERQKTMIAKALAQQTPVILLDEPTAFLDYPSKVETLQLLARLAHEEGKAVLFSSHDLELALQQADVLWLLKEGRLHIKTPSPKFQSSVGEVADFYSLLDE